MPRLSDSMTEGTVVRWLKQPGEHVARGEPIVEIETDKATITYESDVEGVVVQILVGEGQTVEVGTQIALLQDAAEAAFAPPQQQPPPPLAVPAPAPLPMPQETGEYGYAQQTGEEPALQPPSQPPPQQTTAEHAAAAAGFDPNAVSYANEEQVPAEPGDAHGRVKASPIARRLARKLGVDLERVEGTGPGGRVVKEDVEAAANAAAAAPAMTAAPIHAPAPDEPVFTPYQEEQQFAAPPAGAAPIAPPPQPPMPQPPQPVYPQQPYPPQPQQPFPGPPPFVAGMTGGFPAVPQQQPPQQPPVQTQQQTSEQPAAGTATRGTSTPSELTTAQQTVARRMAESKATAPEFFVETDVDMTNAVSYREQLRNAISPVPSFNDFVIKASAQALRQYPKVNGAYKDGHFEQYSDVNVGVVVSADDLLAVPTLFNVDQKGLAQIARESIELADAVRTRSIQPSQLSGGTFSISNLGMYGVDRFTAILNPPQAAILAVGAINREAVIAEDGMSLVVRQMMTVTLTCDHRILYGAEAAEFLGAIKAWLESPQLLPV